MQADYLNISVRLRIGDDPIKIVTTPGDGIGARAPDLGDYHKTSDMADAVIAKL
jgi:hypothetical protein